jgi:hypothetical protein
MRIITLFFLPALFFIKSSFSMWSDDPPNNNYVKPGPLAYSENEELRYIHMIFNSPQDGEVIEVPRGKRFAIVLPYFINFGPETVGWRLGQAYQEVDIIRTKTIRKAELMGNEAGSNIYIFSAAAPKTFKLRFLGQCRDEKRDIVIKIKE